MSVSGISERQDRLRVAAIGEPLIEQLGGSASGKLTVGGDTLNTAVYIARLGARQIETAYVTMLGNDPESALILDTLAQEGVCTSLVVRDSLERPGRYYVDLDAAGERSFRYDRANSAARQLVGHADFPEIGASLRAFDLVYLTGISLAILPDTDRYLLVRLVRDLAKQGVLIAFDTNYRPMLWESKLSAQAVIEALLPSVKIMLTSGEDEQALWGDLSAEFTLKRLEMFVDGPIVVKMGARGHMLRDGGRRVLQEAARCGTVRDTTAAGDAFNAAFIASWLLEQDSIQAADAGSNLAGQVVCHAGALMSPGETPALAALWRRNPTAAHNRGHAQYG